MKEAARLLLLETAGDQAGADQQVVLPDSDNTAYCNGSMEIVPGRGGVISPPDEC